MKFFLGFMMVVDRFQHKSICSYFILFLVGELSICLKHAQSPELKAYQNRAIEYWWGPVREDSRHGFYHLQ